VPQLECPKRSEEKKGVGITRFGKIQNLEIVIWPGVSKKAGSGADGPANP